MAEKKEYQVLEFKGGLAAKIEKLYNEGYKKYRHFADESGKTYIVFKLQTV